MRFRRDGTNAFWYVALDGSRTEQLLAPAATLSGAFACALSPDGMRFVYARRAGEFSQLFLMDLSSRQVQQLTYSASHKYEAAWSPDGRSVAFAANNEDAVHVWRIASAGGDEQQLTLGVERFRHLFYSPDGRWLYVQPSHRNIHRMPADGGPLTPVTTFPNRACSSRSRPSLRTAVGLSTIAEAADPHCGC